MGDHWAISLLKITNFQDIQKTKVKKKILGQKNEELFQKYTKIFGEFGTTSPIHNWWYHVSSQPRVDFAKNQRQSERKSISSVWQYGLFTDHNSHVCWNEEKAKHIFKVIEYALNQQLLTKIPLAWVLFQFTLHLVFRSFCPKTKRSQMV